MLVHNVVANSEEGATLLDEVAKLARANNPKHELFIAVRAGDAIEERLLAIGAELVTRIAPDAAADRSATVIDAVEQQPSS